MYCLCVTGFTQVVMSADLQGLVVMSGSQEVVMMYCLCLCLW